MSEYNEDDRPAQTAALQGPIRLSISLRFMLIVVLACPVVSCKKEAKKKPAAGPKEGELVAGGLCKRGKRHGWRRIRVEYDDGGTGRLGCGEIHGKKEARFDKTIKPVAAVFLGKPGLGPDNRMKFYDARGRLLKRITLYPLASAYLRKDRFLVVVAVPPTLTERCIIRDVKKGRTHDFSCKIRPLFRANSAAWVESDGGLLRAACANLDKRLTKVHAKLPLLMKEIKLRWLTDTTIEVTGALESTGKRWKATYTCP